jgi:carbon-monoxide dehydrogenase small subunit
VTNVGEPKIVRLNINEADYDILVEPRWTLSYVLREKLGLTGTKQACGNGECGHCTVLINGKPMLSCLLLAVESEEKKIITIEGLAKGDKLNPIQQAFLDNHALACGHCTPAMILCAYALLNANHSPTEEEIKKAISGVLCRCIGYVKIIKAIMAAAQALKKGGKNA